MRTRLMNSLVFITVGLFFISACQAADENTSQLTGTNTNAPDNYDSLLFRAEDLGWPTNSYYTRTDDNEELFDVVPVYMVSAGGTARSNPLNPKTGLRYRTNELGAAQFLSVYNEEQGARRVFAELEESGGILGSYEPTSIRFQPEADNISWECWDMIDSRTMNCILLIQHGRYLTTGNVIVDSQDVTLADFEVFINVIQDRLLAQVAAE